MNLDDTVNELMEIARNVKYIDHDGYGPKQSYFEDQIKKVLVKSLIKQSNYCLDAIYKHKNQWDQTQPYNFGLNENKNFTDRIIQLIVNMSVAEIREMISSLEENVK